MPLLWQGNHFLPIVSSLCEVTIEIPPLQIIVPYTMHRWTDPYHVPEIIVIKVRLLTFEKITDQFCSTSISYLILDPSNFLQVDFY